MVYIPPVKRDAFRGIFTTMSFEKIVRDRLREIGMSPIRAAIASGLPRDAIRSVLRGHPPSIDRAQEITKALGLTLQIYHDQNSSSKEKSFQMQRVGDNVRPKPLNNSASYSGIRAAEEQAAYEVDYRAYDPDIDDAEHVMVPKLPVRLSAGPGASGEDETPVGLLAFRREWMRQHSLQPGRVSAVEVAGDSMKPSLNDGDTVLVDHTRAGPRRGKVVAARVGGELFIKRLHTMPPDGWLLVSDNPDYSPLMLGRDDAIIGEIVWQGRWLKR